VIPPKLQERWGLSERLAQALARKESSDCSWCGAKLRARRLARALLDLEGLGEPPRSVAEWVTRDEVRALRVVEINRIEGLHEAISGLPQFEASDYSPGAKPGEIVSGVRSEDLTRLKYPDESFDLVLTSETLEHVPDLSAALSEIRRVLGPCGWHLFTIPLLPNVPKTFARTIILPDGSLDHRAPTICHPGGDSGYPVFTEFGADLPEIVRAAGFDVEMKFGPVTEDDLGQVFVSRKCGR
jgi:SAM-dependent methyltransferase